MARANSFTKVLKLSSGLKTAVYVLQNISQKFALYHSIYWHEMNRVMRTIIELLTLIFY